MSGKWPAVPGRAEWSSCPDPVGWAALGLSAKKARDWWVIAETAKAARAYMAAGMSRSQVHAYRVSRDPEFPSFVSIVAWHRTGMGLRRAGIWRDLQIPPARAARYHAAGWDIAIHPDDATEASTAIFGWVMGMSFEEERWERWLRIKAAPAVVMLAKRRGLAPAEVTALAGVTENLAVLTLAIRGGYDADELRGMDFGDPDVRTALDVAAALTAVDDG